MASAQSLSEKNYGTDSGEDTDTCAVYDEKGVYDHKKYLRRLKRHNLKELTKGCYMCGSHDNVKYYSCGSERTAGSIYCSSVNCSRLYENYQYGKAITSGLPARIKRHYPDLPNAQDMPPGTIACAFCGFDSSNELLECVPSTIYDYKCRLNRRYGINTGCDKKFQQFFCRNRICLKAYADFISRQCNYIPAEIRTNSPNYTCTPLSSPPEDKPGANSSEEEEECEEEEEQEDGQISDDD